MLDLRIQLHKRTDAGFENPAPHVTQDSQILRWGFSKPRQRVK